MKRKRYELAAPPLDSHPVRLRCPDCGDEHVASPWEWRNVYSKAVRCLQCACPAMRVLRSCPDCGGSGRKRWRGQDACDTCTGQGEIIERRP